MDAALGIALWLALGLLPIYLLARHDERRAAQRNYSQKAAADEVLADTG